VLDADKWQEIFDTMKKNKLRTALTAFSVAWGIFILIVLLAAGQGLRNGAEAQFLSDATNSIWVNGGTTTMPFAGYKPGREIRLTNADYEQIRKKVNGVESISAVYRQWDDQVMVYRKEHATYRVRSCTPHHIGLERLRLISGRFINEIDMAECRKVCVIGLPVWKALFKKEDPIDKFIDVGGIKYKVVGLFNDDGRGDNDRIYVPLFTAQKAENGKDHLDNIWLSTGSAGMQQSDGIAESIRQMIAKKYHFNPEDKNAVGIYNNNKEFAKIMGLMDGIRIFLYIIGVLTLIAGIVGVSNIMMIVVKERNREIGVRKALGATPGSIVSLIIQESVFITFIAGYIGLMAGIGLVEVVKATGVEGDFFKNPDVDLKIALSSVLLIIVAGALAGFFPALKAANVEPITALRED
jgi:putative ABC transport system permease protein